MGVFHVFKNCTNGTKSRNAPQIWMHTISTGLCGPFDSFQEDVYLKKRKVFWYFQEL